MTTKKYTPHPHAEAIKAWADGKPVEWRENPFEDWKLIREIGYEYRVKPEEAVDYTVVLPDGRPGVVFTSTIVCLSDYYPASNYQGYLKRTRLDGKVVSFEFISKQLSNNSLI
jgi:hypothetical protein